MPRPWQKKGPPIWIGGRSEAALRRTGRLGDGWLVSSVSASEVEQGIKSIRRHATEAGRQVPEDHYGVLIPFYFSGSADKAFEIAGTRHPPARRLADQRIHRLRHARSGA